MANEIRASGSLVVDDSESEAIPLQVQELLKTIGTKRYTRGKMNVAVTEEAIPLGDLTSCGYAIFINRDATNFINLKVATGGAIFAKLLPSNGFALVYLGSGAQAPYAIADTAACQMDFLILNQ